MPPGLFPLMTCPFDADIFSSFLPTDRVDQGEIEAYSLARLEGAGTSRPFMA